MNTTTNTRGVKYTPEQVERQASILSDTWGVGEAYKMLRAYAAALSAQTTRGVSEVMVEREVVLCPSYRGPDQDRLRTALAPFTTGAGHVE